MHTKYIFLLMIALTLVCVAPSQAQIFVRTEDGAVLQTEASTTAATSWADYDDDGDLDIAITDVFSGIQVYRNDGAGAFILVDVLEDIGNAYGAAWGDLDGDGDLDLVVNSLNSGVWVYVNLGAGDLALQPMSLVSVGDVRDVSLMDVDRDGLVDMFVARRFGSPNMLLRNEGNWVFGGFAEFSGLTDNSVSGAWGDYDGDGDQDLYTTNTSFQADRLYQNTADGIVLDSSLLFDADREFERPGSSQGANWVDIDHDADLDLYVSHTFGRDKVYRNDGATAGGITEFVRMDAGSITRTETTSFGSAWGDVDNDGDLDLVVSNRTGRSVLHLNDGAGHFEEQEIGDVGYGAGVTLIDYDDDGDLDVFMAKGGANFHERNELYRNTIDATRNWLQVRCVGTLSNVSALGARVRIKSVIDGEARWQVREVQARSGRTSQAGHRLHFGLDDATGVDSIVVTWPSGIEQVIEEVSANQVLTIVEEGKDITNIGEEGIGEGAFSGGAIYPNPFTSRTTIRLSVEQAGSATVAVYDVLGRRVRTLLDRDVQPGHVDLSWDARDDSGYRVATGAYFVHAIVAGRRSTASVTFVR